LRELIFPDVNLEARINDLVKALANDRLSLAVLANGHDLFDLALAFLYGLVHVLVVGLHLLDDRIIAILLADHTRVASFLHEAFNFLTTRLVKLLQVDAKASLLLAKELLQLSEVGTGLDLCENVLLDIFDLVVNGLEEQIHG
jgi:hypothetical protein